MSQLKISGDVASPRELDFAGLSALPEQVADVAAEVPGRRGAGVRLRAILDAAGARGAWLLLVSDDGFSIAVPRADVEAGIVAYRLGDGELPGKDGGPRRFYVPASAERGTGQAVDACANVKRLVEIRVSAERPEDTHRH